MRTRSNRKNPELDSKIGVGCIALFGLPFAAAGVVLLGFVAFDVSSWTRMGDWRPVPARVLEARLIESSGESTTYRVEARYEYSIDGVRYVGDRVGLTRGSDNVGSFHRDVYATLRAHRDSGQPITAYVDPAAPRESILFRELRWGLTGLKLVGALLFSGVGFGLMIGAWIAKGRIRTEQSLQAAHPDQPWRWREDWRDGRITGATRSTHIGAWIFAVLWNLVSAPLLYLVPVEVFERGNQLAWFGLLFPIVGIGLLAWAIAATRRWRRFGRSVFAMAAVPAALGGTLRGVIECGASLEAANGLQLTLTCIRKVTTGTRDDRETRERILYQDRQTLRPGAGALGPSGWQLPVRIAIPRDQPQTDLGDASSATLWRLEVDAELPGVDFHDRFEIPVFGAASESTRAETALQDRALPERDAVAQLRSRGIDVSDQADGVRRMVFARGRNRAVAIGLTVFTAVWIGAIWLGVTLGAPLVFPIVFGLVAVLLIYFCLGLWLERTTLTANAESIEVNRAWFGAGKTTTIERALLRSIDIAPGMQAGNRLYHDIKVVTLGRTLKVAKSIDDRRLAQWIKEWLEAS